jgi:methyl-accepting chemotaxis protein
VLRLIRNMFESVRIWHKLALLGGVFLLPMAVLAYFVVSANFQKISYAEGELKGSEYLVPVRKVLEDLQQHRGLSAGVLNGNEAMRGQLSSKGSQIEEDIRAIDAAGQKSGDFLHTSDRWTAIKNKWQSLKERNLTLKSADSFQEHTALIADVLGLITDVGETSNLVLDPQADSNYLSDALVARIPLQTEILGQLRAKGTAIVTKQEIGPDEKSELLILVGQLKRIRDAANKDVELALRYNGKLRSALEAPTKESLTAVDTFSDMLDKRVLKAEKIDMKPQDYFDAATAAIAAGFKLFDAVTPAHTNLIETRIGQIRTTNWIAFGSIGLGLALTILLGYLISRSITGQVNSIMSLFSLIGMGDFKARAAVTSNDELGTMAVSLNAMLDNTLGLIQSRDERDKIQESIQKLLEEISGVADGDLTKEAEVTADVTGAIADSFNNMIEQLRKIISNVQDATLQVSSSANEIHTTAEHLAQGSEAQSMQIVNTSAAVDEMAVSIQQVSDNAAQSAKVAEQALASAKQGADAVQNTIQGMTRIRDQVQETAKRIKRLGESSQQIGEIVQLIDDIADRTSILALNASIQAAMAGEAGRGFAVVAEEVERLAERSTNATKKIANLVKTIQSETNEAVTAMEEGTREVVEGSKLANQAGQALGEIDKVSGRMAELIQSISLAAKQQARASEGVAKAMNEISEVTQQTAAGTKQAAVSVNNLASLADELRGSVSTFRLPGGHGESGPDVLAGRRLPIGIGAGEGKGNGHGHAALAKR